MKKLTLFMIIAALIVSGCAAPQTKAGKGAAYGAAGGAVVGAAAGQAIGHNTESTLIGAAIGAVVGAAAGGGIGHMMDKQEAEYRQALAESEAASVSREGNLLAITLKGDLTFDVNSAEIKPGLISEIDRIADVMIQYPDTRIRVEGHTDSTGSDAFNQSLSERRAQSVSDLLVRRGVGPGRITAQGFGETMPVAGNETAEGRRLNRRVEIRIDPNTQSPAPVG